MKKWVVMWVLAVMLAWTLTLAVTGDHRKAEVAAEMTLFLFWVGVVIGAVCVTALFRYIGIE